MIPPAAAPVAPPPKPSSPWKWIFLGCFGLLLVSGSCIGFIAWKVYQGVGTTPEKAEAIAQEILQFDKPPGFEGKFSMSIAGFKVASLMRDTKAGGGYGMIMLVTIPGGRNNQDKLREQMRTSVEQQREKRDVDMTTLAPQTFKVRGKDTSAEVVRISPKGGGAGILQYSLPVLNAKGDLVMLLLQGTEPAADHDWAQKFIDTIR